MTKLLLSLACAALWMALCGGPSRAQDLRDLILSAEVDRLELTGGLLAFEHEGTVVLPVAELGLALGFFVESNPELRIIEGWALSPERYFILRGADGQIELPDGAIPIAASAYLDELELMGEAYLPTDQLEAIWPVTIQVDIQRLRIVVTPAEPLPAQTRLRRQEQWEDVEAARAALIEPELPNVTVPYRAISAPLIDMESTTTIGASLSGSLNMSGRQDIAFGDLSWFITQTSEFDIPDLRLRYIRDTNVGALPFGLQRIELGDVGSEADGFVVGAVQGRGFTLTTFDHGANYFSDTTVEGDALQGWDAELRLNGALIDFQPIEDDGRYAFTQVPLFSGQNDLVVMLYGPNGQTERRRRTIVADQMSVPRNALAWSFRGGENVPLMHSADDERGAWAQGLVAYGLTDATTLHARVDGLLNEQRAGLARFGFSTSTLGMFIRPELLADVDGNIGGMFSTTYRYRFGNATLRVLQTDGLTLPQLNASTTPLLQQIEFESVNARRLHGVGASFNLNAIWKRFDDGAVALDLSSRQSLAYRPYRVTNTVRHTSTQDTTTLTGRAAVAWTHPNWNGRAALGYDATGRLSIQNVTAAAGWRSDDRRWSWTGSLSRDFIEKCFDMQFNVARQFRNLNIGIEFSGSAPGSTSIGLRLSSSFDPTAPAGQRFSAAGSGSGRVVARIFVDHDGDGAFTRGVDELLPGIGARVNRGIQSSRSDENGTLVLVELDSTRLSTVALALRTIEDPYLVPATEGVQLIARPGTIARIDLPLNPVGSVDGTLLSGPGGNPLRAVDLALVNSTGEIVAETRTSYDGYFAFDQIPLGEFEIVVVRSGRVAGEVAITNDVPFVFGVVANDPNTSA